MKRSETRTRNRPTYRGSPTEEEMYGALLRRDSEWDGLFFVAVKTTGIFCRSICPAKKPKRENVRFFRSTKDCLAAGFRPCKRCRPLEAGGAMPSWLAELMHHLDEDPLRRWTNQEIAQRGIEPKRVNRWFAEHHDMTFQRFLRIRRLTTALQQLSIGEDIDSVALNAGYESISGFRDAFQKAFGISPGAASTKDLPILVNRIPTPLGPMVVAADEQELLLLEFADRRMLETQFRRLAVRRKRSYCPGENAVMQETKRQLDEYFSGIRQAFELPVAFEGSEFQKNVWQALGTIPYGTTTSYERIATSLGKPMASRAIGRANGDNRIAIVIPCHRVIRHNGELSGYGGGRWRKEWLLRHERDSLTGSPRV